MSLLTFSVVLFIIVIALIVYANWPVSASHKSCRCGGDGCDACQPNPCDRCHKPKSRCGCPPAGGCPFC